MKKALALVLALIIAISLASCGETNNENTSDSNATQKAENTVDATEEIINATPDVPPTEVPAPTEAPTSVPATAEPTHIITFSDKSKLASINEITDLKMGDVITTDYMTFTIDSIELVDKLHCMTNSTGQSSYLEEPGIKFLALHGVLTNTGTTHFYSFPYIYFCKINDTLYNYRIDEVQTFLKGATGSKINPGAVFDYVIYARVPDALADAMDTATFTIGLNKSSTQVSESVDASGVKTYNADNWYRISNK